MTNQKPFVSNAMLLILIKLWNGRRQEFIPYCNPAVMRHVISNMVSNKYHVSKHDSPINLLANLFVPTIIAKYGPEIKNNDDKIKNLFMQSYARIYQLFRQQPKVNPVTGKKEATSGIAALYYRAHSEGALVKDTVIKSDNEEDPTFEKFGSTHQIDEIVTSVSDFITLNSSPNYPEQFVSQINRLTHVSSKVLVLMFKSIHKNKYYDYISDLLTLILGRIGIKEKSDICSAQFMIELKKKVISSKNNADAAKITKILDIMLVELFKEIGNYDFNKYSNVQKIQIRTALTHVLVYNLKRAVCHQQVTQQIKSFDIFASV